MSPLTKLFVILMIVCSLLLTGAVVVFVNRQDNERHAREERDIVVKRVEGERDAAQTLAASAQAREKDEARKSNAKIAELAGDILKLNEKVRDAGVEKGQLNNTIATKDAQLTALAQANQATNQNLKDVQTRYDGLVKENDTLRVRNSELAGINTDFQKRLDEAERERRWLNEQVVQLKSEVDRCRKVLADKNISADPLPPLNKAPADIKGVVRGVKVQDDMVFATISLGSADRVAKGMKFTIVNQNSNDFLSFIIIDSVEPNEAFGHLEGPRKQDVARENVVLSQGGL
ncbi:MAG: hypothetical protein ACHRHE_16120 [Tepidisphaerales bacterium]